MGEIWDSYAAGVYDGEGWATISVERGKEGRSDNHHAGIYITQRARHRTVLDKFQAAYGGLVTVRDTKLKGRETWAEQADWHIHKLQEIERFCLAVQPYCIVKAQQIAIMLEFVTGRELGAFLHDSLGRRRGRVLSADEIARRERLRLELKALNQRGSDRTVKIEQPARPLQHRDRSAEVLLPNRGTLSRGEHRPLARLTDEAVRTMRLEYAAGGITMDELALRYGVTPAAIRMAIRRLTWRHVE